MTAGALRIEGTVVRAAFSLDVAIEVAPGATLALVGPNGAGKSSVVAVAAGLLPLTSGTVSLGDRVLDDPASGSWVPPHRRDVGVVLQDLALFPHLDVVDGVAFGLRRRGTRRRAARSMAAQALTAVGLDVASLAGRRAASLSGGEAQRVALARALVVGPAALLLDEPLSAVDATVRPQLRTLLREVLGRLDGPRVVVTHDPVEAAALADEVAVVERGRVVQRGRPEDLARRPATPYVADLVGVNLLAGRGAGATVALGGGAWLVPAEPVVGPVVAVVHPRAVALHVARPEGSARNVWPATVVGIERDPVGGRVRVRLDGPVPLVAELTAAGASALAIEPGTAVWASVKATEIAVSPG